MPVHLIVADVDPLIAEGLSHSLCDLPDVIARPATGPQHAFERCKECRPCVLLAADTVFHEMYELADEADFGGAIRVLVLGSEPESERVISFLRLGCMGYVSRKDALNTLRKAVVAVAAGEIWACRPMLTLFIRELREGSAASLTGRQREILGLIALGYTNTAICEKLYLSPETVRWHVRRLFRAIGAKDRSTAVAYARRYRIAWRRPTHGAYPGGFRPAFALENGGQKPSCAGISNGIS